jgi:hypothetical protein
LIARRFENVQVLADASDRGQARTPVEHITRTFSGQPLSSDSVKTR